MTSRASAVARSTRAAADSAADSSCLRTVTALAIACGVAACAGNPVPAARPDLMHDDWFHFSAEKMPDIIRPDAVLKLSAETEIALDSALARTRNSSERIDFLVDTIFGLQQRDFEYLSAATTPAEQTFRRRAGNCLSLALMTLALADKLGLNTQLLEVPTVPVWERQGKFDLITGHVYVAVRRTRFYDNGIIDLGGDLAIDFDPAVRRSYSGRIASVPISRERGLAMFYNNRGAEAYVNERFDDAYTNYRQAIALDPGFYGTWFNLSQLYVRIGRESVGEVVLSHALDINPESYNGLITMQGMLANQGRDKEARSYELRIRDLRDNDPFYHYRLGAEKMARGDRRDAISSLERAAVLGVGFVEIHEALRDAYRAVGDFAKAKKQEDRIAELGKANHSTSGPTTSRRFQASHIPDRE